MAGTLVYMLALLAMGSGMAVLMFGLSSTHSAMYALQRSFDEHERILRRVRQADLEASSQLAGLQGRLQELRKDQETAKISVSKETSLLTKTHGELRQDLANQVREIKADMEKMHDKQKAASTVQDDIRLQTQTQKASADATSDRVTEVERKLNLLSTKQLALVDRLESYDKAQQKLQGLVESLTRTVEEIRHQQAAEGTQIEDVRQRLHDAQAAAPPISSTKAALVTSSSDVIPTQEKRAASTGALDLHSRPSSEGSSAASSSIESSSSAKQDIQEAAAEHEEAGYRRIPDAADDDGGKEEQTEPSTSPSPAPSAARGGGSLAASATKEAPPGPGPAALPQQLTAYLVSWYRECGCTGMEIEAVTLLAALVRKLGSGRVRTNKCTDTCSWPASTRSMLDLIEVAEESQLTELPTAPSEPGGPVPKLVLVFHTAFQGVCGVPDALLLPARSRADPVGDARRGLYRVSRSMLETDRLDEDAVRACNEQFDAVWVPSKFNVQSFSNSGVGPDKLRVLHEAVDTGLFNCSGSPPAELQAPGGFGVPELDEFLAKIDRAKDFTFLSVFKWEERKNWKALLQAFFNTFPKDVTEVASEEGHVVKKTVRLLIKTQELSWGTSPEGDVQDLVSTLGQEAKEAFDERVLIFKGSLPSEAMPQLYRAADAFVLPTHGEGWGLPLMEAMASGLPTISTNWGGQTEFMNEGNAFLLGYEMVHLDPDVDNGHLWAEPKTSDLQQAMTDVVIQRTAARSRAQRGCQEVHALFTPEAVAEHAIDLMTQLPSVVSH
mmetsp:Transcript_101310/g.295069  ORF Transcript_101310/g.295069 Transcript_101310/m.295069 type:complete len:781 (+) Transcript_101310:68-2410(+)